MIKYLFSINTGRSGSHYLANILRECNNISAFHEPEPVMNGKPMLKFLNGDASEMNLLFNKKLDAIKTNKVNSAVYVETNHTFIKGFGWLLPAVFPHEEIGLIYIKRDKQQIVDSLYRIHCTHFTSSGKEWMMGPLMKNPINQVTPADKIKYRLYSLFPVRLINSRYNKKTLNIKKPWFIKNFEIRMLNWFVDETYCQAEKFKQNFPGIKVFETTVDDLNSIEEYQKMFRFFGLEFNPKPSFYEMLGKPTNLKL